MISAPSMGVSAIIVVRPDTRAAHGTAAHETAARRVPQKEGRLPKPVVLRKR